MSQSDSVNISSWVDSYYRLEGKIDDLLDDIRQLQFQNKHSEARGRIKDFREANHDAFRTTYYALIGTEQFFSDVEEQTNEGAVIDLQELSEEYSDLTEEFQAVNLTHNSPKENPISGGGLSRIYDSEAEEPIIEYTLYSGNIPVLETADSPSQILNTSRLFLNAATIGLEQAAEKSLPIADSEFEEITDETERLMSEITELEEAVESLSGNDSGEDTE